MTDDELITDLLQQLRAADADTRCEAAGALGALGRDGVAAIEPLFGACHDPDPYVRGEAAHSLWELAGACIRAAPEAERLFVAGVPVLVALLDDPSEDVWDSAAGVLERIGPAASAALPRLREVAAGGPPDRAEVVSRVIEAIAGAKLGPAPDPAA